MEKEQEPINNSTEKTVENSEAENHNDLNGNTLSTLLPAESDSTVESSDKRCVLHISLVDLDISFMISNIHPALGELVKIPSAH